jgi:hypothetical protein
MPIVVCYACGRRLQIPEEFLGRRCQCPACGNTFELPAYCFPSISLSAKADYLQGISRSAEPPEARTAPTTPEPAPPPGQGESVPDPCEVRDHVGAPLPQDVDFFAPAPAEIGPIVSAYSSLRTGVRSRHPGLRLGLLLAAGGLAALAAVALVAATEGHELIWRPLQRDPNQRLTLAATGKPHPRGYYLIWPALAGLPAAGIAWRLSHFRHTCTYVGREGVARFRCAGRRDRLTRREVFLFRDADVLRVRHDSPRGRSIRYAFSWTNVAGQQRYVVVGRHHRKNGRPEATDPYYFGCSAEAAWSNYLLPVAFRQLELSGAVLFLLKGDNWIRLGREALVLHFGGKEEEWPAREVAGVKVDGGVVRIRRRGAREGWFSSSGVFKFEFGCLGNAQVFFFLVVKVLGVPVG